MSRIGKQHITLPPKTELTVVNGDVVVKGPLGELRRSFKTDISISVVDGVVTLVPKENPEEHSALWGTYASHIKNMVAGVNKPYEKKLILDGVGYRSEVKGKELVMQLGFSHPVVLQIPDGITLSVEKNTMTMSAIDKEVLGQFAATVRAQKPPEPYKGKGFRYSDEVIRRKEGKRAA
ncbi:50S ribosomal protein L6 [Candidatus Campbellbacteria bacterium]|nr:MAG: 50S ribosomal protein L6 [Candidatus Campbellbacteria bacterium]